ncbi:MAG: NAD-dependent protein deacylase [Clostridia bacterium]|nr:NAD-dependent protein deacylase [Clostridia bacterium]
MNEAAVRTLRALIAGAQRIVFFGGAGVSTESGIEDFRSESGIYAARNKYGLSPELMLSHSFFEQYPEQFFDYYRSTLSRTGFEPNAAHRALAKLEREGKLTAVITQNVDNLHQLAGSVNVLELHGSAYRNYCVRCGKSYSIEHINESEGVPRCECGGTVKPDVVLYGESLDYDVMTAAIAQLRRADLLIVGGTSLVVYPAASLVSYYGGSDIVLINKSATSLDESAGLVIREPIGEVLAAAVGI